MLHQSASFSRKLHKYLNQKNAMHPVQYMVLIEVAICINFLYFLKYRMAGGEFPPPGPRVIWNFLGKKIAAKFFDGGDGLFVVLCWCFQLIVLEPEHIDAKLLIDRLE